MVNLVSPTSDPKANNIGDIVDLNVANNIKNVTRQMQVMQQRLAGAINTLDVRTGGLLVYANNAAAIAGGLVVGDFYRSGADPDVVHVVH
jgi:hypothetical protein